MKPQNNIVNTKLPAVLSRPSSVSVVANSTPDDRARTHGGVDVIDQTVLYPLRIEPIYQYRPWGGRRLADLLAAPLPGDGPIGEAWILSDRDDHSSLVASGVFKGKTLTELLKRFPEQMMGKWAGRFSRFPLLLKFLDVRDALSVQVHPSDQQTRYLPAGERGKTEAWVVLETGPESRVYAGLERAVTADTLRKAIADGTLAEHLASFVPSPGQSVFVPAGTVHSLSDLVVFEIQENSDVTFRLYDWNHVDPVTGRHRSLQVDQALACVDFLQGAVGPVVPVVEETGPVLRERLFRSEQFGVWRLRGSASFTVGSQGEPRAVVCLAGDGELGFDGAHYPFTRGDVLFLPAVIGACLCRTHGTVSLLEVSLPESAQTNEKANRF